MSLRNFTVAQRKRLELLGVIPEQVEHLRLACTVMPLWLQSPPARNEVRDILENVASLSSQLETRLQEIVKQRDRAHGYAHGLIEVRYWAARPGDGEPTASHHFLPRLKALTDAANQAAESLPKEQARRRASTSPIGRIQDALLQGWRDAHGTRVTTDNRPQKTPPKYPVKLRPSSSPTSAFLELCCICYEVSGVDEANPERAIKAYLRQTTQRRKDMLLALEKGLQLDSISLARDDRPAKK